MFIQLFGKYLVEHDILTEDALSDIFVKQRTNRAKLGTIAVADNFITKEQADEINQLQMTMDKRFGEIAIEQGYLTQDQLDTIIARQGSSYMTFIQLLIEGNYVTFSQLDSCIRDFQKELGFSTNDMIALQKDDLNTILSLFAFASMPYVTDIIGQVLRNITRFVTGNYYIERLKKVDSLSYKYLITQQSTGSHNIVIGFACDEEEQGFINLASEFGNCSLDNIGELTLDIIGEFTNITSGLFTSEISRKYKDKELDMLPPVVYKNQEIKGNGYVLPIYINGKHLSLFVTVDSEVSVGSEPFHYETVVEEGSIIPEDSKGTFVIVDDSKMSRSILRGILDEEGYTVVAEATNGLEGVEAYKTYSPDAITLDITMPVMDGIEALSQIMEYDSNAHAIIISAAGQQKKIIDALKLGASRFIVKPFEKAEVIKAIGEI